MKCDVVSGGGWCFSRLVRVMIAVLAFGLFAVPLTAQVCSESNDQLCLLGDRYAVTVDWDDGQGGNGAGQVVPTTSDDSGLFYFFQAENWELLVKLIDACGFNQHVWVYAAATTDRGYDLMVRDTNTGAERIFSNPVGVRSPAFADSEAFDCDGSRTGLSSSSLASKSKDAELRLMIEALGVFTVGSDGTYSTIQDAVDAVINADGIGEIRVQVGVYSEAVSIASGSAIEITLSGGWNASFTVMKPDQLSTIHGFDTVRPLTVDIDAGRLEVRGFDLTAGAGVNGGGVSARLEGSAELILDDLDVHDNVTTNSHSASGGGVDVFALHSSRFEMTNSVVRDNVAGILGDDDSNPAGGGLALFSYSLATSSVVGNKFTRNELVGEGQRTGVGVYLQLYGSGIHRFDENLVAQNFCEGDSGCVGSGVALWPAQSTTLEARRNRVSGNRMPETVPHPQASLVSVDNSMLTFTDSVVADGSRMGLEARVRDNSAIELLNITVAGHQERGVLGFVAGTLVFANSVVFGNVDDVSIPNGATTSNNLLGVDPLFANPLTGNYRVKAGSPAINNGSSTLQNLGAVDLAGQPRIQGANVDIGAFEFAEGPVQPCVADEETHCLLGGRFEVKVTWEDFAASTGDGQVVPTSALLAPSGDSGLFYFFAPDNWEFLIKLIDACGFNQHFWVYGAATTNVAYELTVRDTETGSVRLYDNKLGERSPAITDTSAFATCP